MASLDYDYYLIRKTLFRSANKYLVYQFKHEKSLLCSGIVKKKEKKGKKRPEGCSMMFSKISHHGLKLR
jgi:hypothetical protein